MPFSLVWLDQITVRCWTQSCHLARLSLRSLILIPSAKRVHQPVLAVVGSETAPIFSEGHALLKQWMPHAEELVVPQATHALQLMNPRAVADGLTRFFTRHKL